MAAFGPAQPTPGRTLNFPGKLAADEQGELRVTLAPDSPCVKVLLEFDSKSLWVSGEGRVPGTQAFQLKPATDAPREHVFRFGTTSNDSSGTKTISVFLQDKDGLVLLTEDCVVQFEKPPGPTGQLKDVLETIHWIQRQLNVSIWVVSVAALLVGTFWLYLKVAAMAPDDRWKLLTELQLAPERFQGNWAEDFVLDPALKKWSNAADWNDAAQHWTVAQSLATKQVENGLAEIDGPAWGMPRPSVFHNEDLYDFLLDMQSTFPKGGSVSWAMRAQSDAARGYIFTIQQSGRRAHLDGIVKLGSAKSAPLMPIHGFDLPHDCCEDGDYFKIKIRATGYRFILESFALFSKVADSNRAGNGRSFDLNYEFRDGYGSFRHGGLALFANQGSGKPQIEYVYVRDAK
jgi:hypothetical protein